MTGDTKPMMGLTEHLQRAYPFVVHVDPAGGYVVTFPDLPGCMTQAETLAEVLAMAEEARRLWITVEFEDGTDIPLPSFPEEHSGKFNLRLPKSLHRALAESAESDGTSLNQYVLSLLARADAQARIEHKIDEMAAQFRRPDSADHRSERPSSSVSRPTRMSGR